MSDLLIKQLPKLQPRWIVWLIWGLLTITSLAGLRYYRIDNTIQRWMPNLASSEVASSFIVIGFDPAKTNRFALAEVLRRDADIANVYFIAGDGNMEGLLALPTPGVTGTAFLEAVKTQLGADMAKVALGGPAVFSAALDHWSQRGLPLASGLILLIGAMVLALTTRRWRCVIEGMAAVLMSQLVLVGLIAWTGTAMDMVLSMTPALMMGLGFSFAAHRALRPAVRTTLFLSMATTCFAFATFVFTDFPPIRSFALWSAFGIMLTGCAVITLVTPTTLEKNVSHKPTTKSFSTRYAHAILIASAAVTLAGFAAIPWLRMERDTLAYFPPDAKIVRDYQILNDQLTGMLPFEVSVDGNANPTNMLLKTTAGGGLRRVIPLGSSTKASSQTYLGLAENQSLSQLIDAQPAWQSWAKNNGVTLQWTGVAAQMAHIQQAVMSAARWALPAMIVVAGFAVWLVDRRWKIVCISLWVNTFPVAVVILLLAIVGHPVGLPTLVISALAVGIAIDDTLHILVARRTVQTMAQAVAVCRTPCLGSSLATAGCMLTFMVCPFRPTAEFGLLLATAVLAAAVGDLVLLPAAAKVIGDHNA